MSQRIIGRPTAAYDAAATAVRISYDADKGFNPLEDPSITHELCHYGQNLTTWLGLVQTVMANELFFAASQIALREPDRQLPLAINVPGDEAPLYWHQARVALAFQEHVIGKPNLVTTIDDIEKLTAIQAHLNSAIFGQGEENPFYYSLQGRGPGFGLSVEEGDFFFRLDGAFVQELHARSTEFIARWAHGHLTMEEAVSYFLFSTRSPFSLLYLAVQKLVVERFGLLAYDIPDSLFLCHLCSFLALNCSSLRGDSNNMPWREIGTAKLKLRYRSPGEVFLHALSAALEILHSPGYAVEHYFSLMSATLTRLGTSQLEGILTSNTDLVADQFAPIVEAAVNQEDRRFPHDRYLYRKWADSRAAIMWLRDTAKEGNVMDFVLAPYSMIANATVSGPLIITPTRFRLLTTPSRMTDSEVEIDKERMHGLMMAFITNKLWFSGNLTCLEGSTSPTRGSIIDCDKVDCGLGDKSQLYSGRCQNALWLKWLGSYPGLSSWLSKEELLRWSI